MLGTVAPEPARPMETRVGSKPAPLPRTAQTFSLPESLMARTGQRHSPRGMMERYLPRNLLVILISW